MLNKNTLHALFLFIFILLGKHVSELLACSISNIINTHFLVKHMIGFFILYTTLISVEKKEDLFVLFIKTIILYIWFIIITKTTRRINISIIIILLITYFIYLYNERLKKKTKNIYNNNLIKILTVYEKYIIYIVATLSIFGFIVYIGEKKIDFKNNFSWIDFLFYRTEENICNNTKSDIINKLNYFERAQAAFINPNDIEIFIEKQYL